MSFFGRAFNLARGAVKVGIGGDEARSDAAVEAELRRLDALRQAETPTVTREATREATREIPRPTLRKPAEPTSSSGAPSAGSPPAPPELNPDGSRKRSL